VKTLPLGLAVGVEENNVGFRDGAVVTVKVGWPKTFINSVNNAIIENTLTL
jgi:hypothetical protein